jgi:hypothetical protein
MASIRSLACDGAGGEQDEAFGTGPAFSGGLLAETDDPEEVSQAMVEGALQSTKSLVALVRHSSQPNIQLYIPEERLAAGTSNDCRMILYKFNKGTRELPAPALPPRPLRWD